MGGDVGRERKRERGNADVPQTSKGKKREGAAGGRHQKRPEIEIEDNRRHRERERRGASPTTSYVRVVQNSSENYEQREQLELRRANYCEVEPHPAFSRSSVFAHFHFGSIKRPSPFSLWTLESLFDVPFFLVLSLRLSLLLRTWLNKAIRHAIPSFYSPCSFLSSALVSALLF